MMSKIYGILGTVILLLCLSVFVLYRQNKELATERDKYKENTTALLSDIKRMRIDSTTTAVDVNVLKLSLDEYKRYRSEDAKQIEKLGIKLRDLQTAAKHNLEVNAPIFAELKDSTVIRDTVVVGIKKIEMNTPYLQVNGIIENNQLSGNIHLPVNLLQAIWIEPKHKFLWWRWGVKAVHQTISSDNPYVEVKYSEVIEILR